MSQGITISAVMALASRNGGAKSIRYCGKTYENLSGISVSAQDPKGDKVYVNCNNGKTIKLKVSSTSCLSGYSILAAYLDGEKLESDIAGSLYVPMIRPLNRGVRARQYGRPGWLTTRPSQKF